MQDFATTATLEIDDDYQQVLLLIGTENIAFEKSGAYEYIVNIAVPLSAILSLKELRQIWLKDRKIIEHLKSVITRKNKAIGEKWYEKAASLRDLEWSIIKDATAINFSEYHHTISRNFGSTRTYFLFRK